MFNRHVLKFGFVLFAFLLLFSCAQKGPSLAPSTAAQIDGDMYASKVDNFLVIFDASSSMYDKYNGTKKFDIAKRIAMDMNITLPEMGQTGGLRTFGHSPKVSKNPTELFYGMEKYSSAAFSQGLDKVTEPGGTSPLCKAFIAAAGDFEPFAGKNAVVIISDGLEKGCSSLEQAKMLKEKYGASICTYTILVGNAPEGEKLMKELANIGECGFFTTADQLLDPAEMRAFVEKVFLTDKPVVKVAAPAPAPAPAPGPKDSDNDGVTDDKDKCPNTPAGARVNADGCWVLDQVLFDFDKSVIKPAAYSFLDEVATILEKNPAMNVNLQGHTDNIGTAKYNMGLSLRRADAVKQYLINKGISADRLATEGFGFSDPATSNDTAEGRALNRRVIIQPDTM